MWERGDLRPETDLNELAMALLMALHGGTLLSRPLRTTEPIRAATNAALAYIRSFTT
jgi:hypothetical protein